MKRGEIYVIDLGPVVGHEVGGVRPVVVVSNDVNNEVPVFVAVVPATNAGENRLGLVVPAARSGRPDDIVVLTPHVRVVDARRFPDQPSGAVPSDLLTQITFALKVYLDIQ